MAPKRHKKAAKHSKKSTTKARSAAKHHAARPTARPKRELSVKTTGFEKVAKTRTKGQIFSELSSSTGLTRKEVGNVFDNLSTLMGHDLSKGPGTFQIPGLLKVMVVNKPAVPARRGINPFTGQEMMFKAKPARNVVRARPLKGLKDMVR